MQMFSKKERGRQLLTFNGCQHTNSIYTGSGDIASNLRRKLKKNYSCVWPPVSSVAAVILSNPHYSIWTVRVLGPVNFLWSVVHLPTFIWEPLAEGQFCVLCSLRSLCKTLESDFHCCCAAQHKENMKDLMCFILIGTSFLMPLSK